MRDIKDELKAAIDAFNFQPGSMVYDAYSEIISLRHKVSPARGGLEAVREAMETSGPYEARICKDMPTGCCDYGVVSLTEGREVCRVWREQDARAIAAALAAPATPAIDHDAHAFAAEARAIADSLPRGGRRADTIHKCADFIEAQARKLATPAGGGRGGARSDR